jgi:hypothetical protein
MAVAGSLQVIYERIFGQQHRDHHQQTCAHCGRPSRPRAWSPTRARRLSSGGRCTSCWPDGCRGAASSTRPSSRRCYGFTLLTWFIAIGAVIVLGAAAGATWDQRKGRLTGGTKAGSSDQGYNGSRPPAPRAGSSRHKLRLPASISVTKADGSTATVHVTLGQLPGS